MFQESEIVNLGFGFASLIVVFYLSKRFEIPKSKYVYAGFSFILLAYVFTVIEGVVFHDLFDNLEHLCYAVSSILFFIYCWSLVKLSHINPRDNDRDTFL